jgi:glycosyltransferase involved in cell wall biosynthesis
MKVLFVTPYNPANPTFGGALRIFHILNQLCKRHDVTVTGFSEPGGELLLAQQIPTLQGKIHFVKNPYSSFAERWNQAVSLFSSHCRWHRAIRLSPLQEVINRILEKEKFDVIHCEFPDMAFHKFNSNAMKVMDAHNVEYDNLRRMAKVKNNPLRRFYYRHESEKLKRDEIAICREQDAIFTTSERDKELFQKDVPGVPKFVIPNGVDLNYMKTTGTEPENHSLVFVGVMTYVPNNDGISWFLDEIFPRIVSKIPGAKIYIVGKNPPASIANRASNNIVVTGFVDDVRPIIEKSSVYVVPLRMGGGTRLKIMEALALEKPIVTTSIGCEGIDVEHRESVLIADQPELFAESVIELMRDQELANRLAKNGYELVQQQYGWDFIGKKLDETYRTLAGMITPEKSSSQNKKRDKNYALDEYKI